MLTRRKLLQTAGSAGIALAAFGSGTVRAQSRPFTFCSWGGALSAMEKGAFMDPAAAKFGVPITNTSPMAYAKIKAMVEANAVEWDLGDVGGQFIYQGRDQGLLEKMDFSIIDVSKLDKYWVTDYGIYTSTGATVIAYNTNLFPEGKGPQSWKDFWDVKAFPGPRTLYNRFYYNYEAAVLAGGVKRNEVYPATDEKVKLAFAKLAEIKPNVKTWWSLGAQPVQLLTSGEVAIGSAWSGRVLDAQKEKAPAAMTYKDAIAWGNAFVVPKGSPYKDLAMKVINYAISEEAQTAVLGYGSYGPMLASAAGKATPDQAKLYVSYPANMQEACVFNDEEVAKYLAKYDEEWKKFQLA